jgi:putative flippase GtrA
MTINFWFDSNAWLRASKNTSVCLLGCSIGDLGVILLFQNLDTEFPIWLIMILAIIAGIITSFILEAIVLRLSEGFTWVHAIKIAINMSLISMLAMEIVMNLTDYFITGGAIITWSVLPFILLAGFLTPLPYNYWKLKTLGQGCN